ncbi:MAG: pyruvate kinase [Alphaproteobacteria bacterium]|jgi:pyruvate kinase|nr:pyruvate kinase [Alphaproteobacteria bacterium]HJP20811.1 pyruvate kinase [Alphaproteobacteria bacterium]
MRRQRSSKIIATLGPASAGAEVIEALFLAGADVFRLNFSHGERETHQATHAAIRELERRSGRPIAILADLQGPKLRLGSFAKGRAELAPGQRFRLDLTQEPGNAKRAPLPHPEIFAALEVGTEVLIDDGRIRLRVDKVEADQAQTEVLAGGEISDRKGVNLPGAVLPITALTDKDRGDLQFALDLDVDWVALSFVQRPEDVAEVRKIIAGRAGLMAKIEKPSAIEHLEDIIDIADGLMVARGDLGVELPVEEVPGLQKRIIRAARAAGKPVVVATQMLESMVHAAMPTRAEVSDVGTAVYDGADAMMLSAETASGAYPVEAVTMMNRVIEQVESDDLYRNLMDAEHLPPEATAADAISAAARQVAETLKAGAIVTYTGTGSTALRAARERPVVPILVLTPKLDTARRLAVVWGVHCVQTEDTTDFTDMVERAGRIALRDAFATGGDRLVITAGVPFGTPGATNVLRIAWVEEHHEPV